MSEAANENVEFVAILEGYVTTASEETEPLPGVVLTLTEEGRPPRETVSNAEGHYQFTEVVEGVAQLTAQMPGFHTVECSHIVLHSGLNAIDLTMAPEAVEA